MSSFSSRVCGVHVCERLNSLDSLVPHLVAVGCAQHSFPGFPLQTFLFLDGNRELEIRVALMGLWPTVLLKDLFMADTRQFVSI
ncbi:hypothetical protein IRJ41_010149 [Triplophysa rosa]|uniref:Uncharacterized protein n=1 Tax=Triplophysa rosa TaxID=992332 RepID=A0A9W7TWR8_TRIRA|nr:hypothetical protein IRJ41_010149 [Triplophysa rosa]